MPHKGICQIVNALMCGWNISPIQKQSALGSEPDCPGLAIGYQNIQ